MNAQISAPYETPIWIKNLFMKPLSLILFFFVRWCYPLVTDDISKYLLRVEIDIGNVDGPAWTSYNI